MPPPYIAAHWSVLASVPYQGQGPVGEPPAHWATKHKVTGVPNQSSLPNHQLDRSTVRKICRDPNHHVLFGHACAMAWGGQGSGGSGGTRHVRAAWNANTKLSKHLNLLRGGRLSRAAAYNLFLNQPIPGIGPSYFTKLLYFFSPAPSFYIMDQWTGKSVNLLTGNPVVRIGGNTPSPFNKAGNYQAFCEEVDLIAGMLGCSGEFAEERLFSKGGHHRWPWRAHVWTNWKTAKPKARYRAANMCATYPHIPAKDF
jgi:hypothetical protein